MGGIVPILRQQQVVGQFAIRRTEVCPLALIKEWMPAPRFREDKLRGHDAKGN